MLFKQCRCGIKIPYTDKYCPECTDLVRREKAESNRLYDKTKRKNANIYGTKRWHKVRKEALIRDNYLCVCCLADNKISYADLVHHIIEVTGNENKAYDIFNLISVCRCCHTEIHKEYDKSDKSKKDMQDKLYKLISKENKNGDNE